MTRVEKNKKRYERKSLVILLLIGILTLIKLIMKGLLWLLVHLVILMYKLIRLIDNLTAKVFMKLPRLIKVSIIYTMLGLSIFTIFNLVDTNKVEVKVVEQKVVDTIVNTNDNNIALNNTTEESQETTETSIDLGDENANNIYNKAIELGLTKEQSLIIVSISRHETGNWKSQVFINSHNFGGVMCNTGLRSYNTYEEGLTHFVTLLKTYYFDLGLTTIEQIGNKYCPVGASNDPTGLNRNWIPSVTNIYNSYLASVK